MGGIHCMYTSANKPFVSLVFCFVFFGTSHWSSPSFVHFWWCCKCVNKQHEKVHYHCSLLAGLYRKLHMKKLRKSMIGKQNRRGGEKKNKQTPSYNKPGHYLPMLRFIFTSFIKQIYNTGGHECFLKRGFRCLTHLVCVEIIITQKKKKKTFGKLMFLLASI